MKENDLRSLIAQGIRRCRKRLGLTIEGLAEVASINTSYLAHIETSNKTPSMATLAKILTALDVEPAEIFRGNQKTLSQSLDTTDRRLQMALRGLKQSQKGDLLAILNKMKSPKQTKALRTFLKA